MQLREGLADYARFGRAGTVGRSAANEREAVAETEMPGDPFGQKVGFGGGYGKCRALRLQAGQQFGDSRVKLVFEDSLPAEVFAVFFGRLVGLGGGHAVKFAERIPQRRPDKGTERRQVFDFDPEVPQCVLYRAGDALHRVGQRAVEVEKEVFPVHKFSGFLCGNGQSSPFILFLPGFPAGKCMTGHRWTQYGPQL